MKNPKEKQEEVHIHAPKKEVTKKQPEKECDKKPFTPKKTI